MVITEEFFGVILKLFACGTFFMWIYSVLLIISSRCNGRELMMATPQ